MLPTLSKGYSVNADIQVSRRLESGNEWALYEVSHHQRILLAAPSLEEYWSGFGLLPDGAFQPLTVNGINAGYLISAEAFRLESLEGALSPQNLGDAKIFALALKESRKLIGDEVSLHGAIYAEEYLRLLPVTDGGEKEPDDVILGKWLTGGVPVSVEDYDEIKPILSWLTPSGFVQIARAFGIEVQANEEERSQKSKEGEATTAELASPDMPKEAFVLHGRPELAEFFNDYIIDIVRNAEEYERMGIGFPGAVLLYGPPGSGKTYAVDQLVKYLNWPIYTISSGTIGSPYIHETSKKIAQIFEEAEKNAPAVVVIDEMESFLSNREMSGTNLHHTEEVGEFLRLLQQAQENRVLVVAMTNLLDSIDPAVKRKGRFEHIIEVGVPSIEEIESLLTKLLEKLPKEDGLSLHDIAEALEGGSMADVSYLVREAGRLAVKKKTMCVTQEIVDEILGKFDHEEENHHVIGFQLEKTDYKEA